jgi:glucose/sorbosone dehydrogenase
MMRTLLGVALALLLAAPAAAAPSLVKIGDFAEPVHVASPPNDARVFVVEKAGRIRIVGRGTFLDISGLVNGGDEERGLLSMAFAPDYATSGRFYVFYTAADPNGQIRVVEYRRSANPDRADANSARPIFAAQHDPEFHNGGQLQFGPDGMLYVSIGDGQDGANAQDLTVPYGKILRLDPATGGAAAGNPHGRIWAYGLRNPWRFSFDRQTGDLVIGDVGETQWEEIDWAPAPLRGRNLNFGWPGCEGPDAGHTCGEDPVVAMDHSPPDTFCAIVGGYVVRDPGLPTLNGRYIYGDNCNSSLWVATARTGAANHATALTVPRLTSFGQDACGHIYAASQGGPVYRIQDGAMSACAQGPTDTTKPGVAVALAGLKTALKKRRLLVRVRCTEVCRATVGTRLLKVRRLGGRHRNLTANHRVTIRLKLTKKVTKKLRRRVNRKGFVRVNVTVRGTDAAGNTRTVHRRARIKRR